MPNLNKFNSNPKLAQKIQTERQDILPPFILEIPILFNILEAFITWRQHLTDITTLSERLIKIKILLKFLFKRNFKIFTNSLIESSWYFLNKTRVIAAVCWIMKSSLRKWNYFAVKEILAEISISKMSFKMK